MYDARAENDTLDERRFILRTIQGNRYMLMNETENIIESVSEFDYWM